MKTLVSSKGMIVSTLLLTSGLINPAYANTSGQTVRVYPNSTTQSSATNRTVRRASPVNTSETNGTTGTYRQGGTQTVRVGRSQQNAQPNTQKSQCTQTNVSRFINILETEVAQNMSVKLDYDDGFLQLLDKRTPLTFQKLVAKRPAKDWSYYVRDINSYRVTSRYSPKQFILDINFESDGPEIKGICHGCVGNDDRRAPDVNWTNPKLSLHLRPYGQNGSIHFWVEEVKFHGDINVNGPFKKVLVIFKRQLRNTFKKSVIKTLRDPYIRREIAKPFNREIRRMGVTGLERIRFDGHDMFLCTE